MICKNRGPPKRPSTVLQTGICYSPPVPRGRWRSGSALPEIPSSPASGGRTRSAAVRPHSASARSQVRCTCGCASTACRKNSRCTHSGTKCKTHHRKSTFCAPFSSSESRGCKSHPASPAYPAAYSYRPPSTRSASSFAIRCASSGVTSPAAKLCTR